MHARSQALARPALLTLALFLASALLRADPVVPARWWTDQQLLTADAPADHDPVTMGQLKNVVWNVAKVLDARFTDVGGCGQALRNTIQLWDGAFPSTPSALPHTPIPRSNFYNPFYPGGIMRADIGRFYPGMKSVVNQGQLKNMAKLVYDRLYELGEPIELKDRDPTTHGLRPFTVDPTDPTQLPWGPAFGKPKDFDPARQGQLKFCFSFEIPTESSVGGQVIAWGDNSDGQATVPSSLSNVIAISAGARHSLALKADSSVLAWGTANGRPLNGWSPWSSTTTGGVAIASGATHGLALKKDGSVMAWNTLGTWGITYDMAEVGQSNVPTDLNGVVAIAAGQFHSLALRYDGTVVAWGAGSYTYNGNRVRTDYGQTTIPSGLRDVVSIAAGKYHSLAVKSDGSVVVWGGTSAPDFYTSTYFGRFDAAGNTTEQLIENYGETRSLVPPNLTAMMVAGTGQSSLALRFDGSVVAWGGNSWARISTPATLGNGVQISDSDYGHLFLKADGTVLSWRSDGSFNTDVPSSVRDAVALASGRKHSLALVHTPTRTHSSTAPVFTSPSYCIAASDWDNGVFYRSQIANGPATFAAAGLPPGLIIDATTGIISGRPTVGHTMNVAITATNAGGSARKLVRFYLGNLLPRFINDSYVTQPEGSGVADVYYRALLQHGTATFSATGLPPGLTIDPTTGIVSGTATQLDVTDAVITATTPLGSTSLTVHFDLNRLRPRLETSSLAVGTLGLPYANSLLLANTSQVEITGLPAGLTYSQETHSISGTPGTSGSFILRLALTGPFGTAVQGLTLNIKNVAVWGLNNIGQQLNLLADVAAVATGGNHVLLVTQGGVVKTIGYYLSPYPVPTNLGEVIAVAAGADHNLVLRRDGTVLGWGSNIYGESTPPSGLSSVIAIAAGGGQSLALRSDGTVVAWGRLKSAPSGLRDVVAISTSDLHSLALKRDGTVTSWDNNYPGQAPAVPTGMSAVQAIAAGGFGIGTSQHDIGLLSNGSVRAWPITTEPSVQIPADLNSVVAVATGKNHGLALLADGTIRSWGSYSNQYVTDTPPTGLAQVGMVAAAGNISVTLMSDTTGSLPPVIASDHYSIRHEGSGPSAVYYRTRALNTSTSNAATGLPPGLSMNTATGVVTGEPTATGEYAATISATNAAGTGSAVVRFFVPSDP